MVRVVGFEPTRLAAQEPKSCMSTISIIPAYEAVGAIRLLFILLHHVCEIKQNRKTFTEVTAPKSTESTNSTMPAYLLLHFNRTHPRIAVR